MNRRLLNLSNLKKNLWNEKKKKKKADIESAKALNCARAAAEYFRRLQALEDVGPRYKSEHYPSDKERIAYIEQIADERNEPPITKVDWKACIQDKLQKGVIELREGRTIFRKSPLTVGKGAYTAAGSTIPNDVPPNALAFGHARQANKEGCAQKLPPKL